MGKKEHEEDGDDDDEWQFLPILIKTYEKLTPAKMLSSRVPNMPDYSYSSILDAMKELYEDVQSLGYAKPSLLEQVMLVWLMDVAPEKVTDNNVKAIHEFACVVGDKVKEKARYPPETAIALVRIDSLLGRVSEIIGRIKKQSSGSRNRRTSSRQNKIPSIGPSPRFAIVAY